jgi:hypothetical protein
VADALIHADHRLHWPRWAGFGSALKAGEEARENVLDALRTVLTSDEELTGETSGSDRELRFVPAA